MPGDTVTIVQMCGVCRAEVGTIQVKKENMMLSTRAQVWCPNCQAQRPEIRDVVGRLTTIENQKAPYPESSWR